MSTKSNVRLPPDGILSPSLCSFQKHLQNLAYGSLPASTFSDGILSPSPPVLLLEISSLAYDSFPSEFPNGIYKPIPVSSSMASANFQVYSSVQSSSTSRLRKA